jgi:ribosomal protein S18 acetylase RimI-like enzyme
MAIEPGQQFDAITNIDYEFTQGEPDLMHHHVQATHEGKPVGYIEWHHKNGLVTGVEVTPEYRRRGVATELWNQAHKAASSTRGVPRPRHSSDRTDSGDSWAKSVGGPVPRRLDPEQ